MTLRSFPGRAASHWRTAALVLLVATLGGCSRTAGPFPPPPTPIPDAGWTERGIASWYGEAFHGRTTASGEVYDMEEPTAAHRTLPFGTMVLVENLDTGRSTTLRINDRGPYVQGRTIDVSRRGARELGMLVSGIAAVRVTVLQAPPGERSRLDERTLSPALARATRGSVQGRPSPQFGASPDP